MAEPSFDELIKEREGPPLSFPHYSGPFSNRFPSFFVSKHNNNKRAKRHVCFFKSIMAIINYISCS